MTVPSKILIFGATSAIAFETAKLFAQKGAFLFLCARNEEELRRLSDDLTVRGASEVGFAVFDALDESSIHKAIESCLFKYPDLDGLLIAHGTLPDQHICETDLKVMKDCISTNFSSAATILTRLSNFFEEKGRGTIIGISSAAGDRGRQSNYVYGAAKGALTVFLSGLRQRLSKSGVKVITIKPGFVDTPMTAGFKKGILFVGPEVIAKGIYRAVQKGKDSVYLPWFWWFILMVIIHIPETIFKRLKL